jgi:hypothetical protein
MSMDVLLLCDFVLRALSFSLNGGSSVHCSFTNVEHHFCCPRKAWVGLVKNCR